MKINIAELGPSLKKLRGKDTLKVLGENLNLSVSHIAEMESGEKLPSVNVLMRYSDRLSKKLEVIFDGR